MLNVHFIIPLKQKIRGRSLIKKFIIEKVIKKNSHNEGSSLQMYLSLSFCSYVPLFIWMKQQKCSHHHLEITHNSHSSLLCTFLFFVTMDTKWKKWNQKSLNPCQEEIQSAYWRSDVQYEQFYVFFKVIVSGNFQYCP